MRGDDGLGAIVARQRGQRVVARGAEPHRMAAPALVERRGDHRAFRNRRGNALDRRRCDPRHVAERDDPSRGIPRRDNAAREARTHAVVRVRAADDARTRGGKGRSQRRIVRAHDRDDLRHDAKQIPARPHADGFVARHADRMPAARAPRSERSCASSLAPPKRSPRPAAEQNAGKTGHGTISQCRAVASGTSSRQSRRTPPRHGPTPTPTGSCSRRASRSRRRPRR